MNMVTLLHAFVIAILGGYALFFLPLPAYFLNNNLFIDTLSVYEIFLAGIIFSLAALYAKGYSESLIRDGELNPKNIKLFYAVFNALLLTLILAFSSNNLALLWIFAELSTVLSALLIVLLNAKENIVAAMKYVFITSIAMVFSLLGLILLFATTKYSIGEATLNWSVLLKNADMLPPELFIFCLVLFFIGFAAKAGLAPFHIWLPAAHSKAPSNVSAILSSTVISIGIYALIRFFALAKQNPLVFPFASHLFLAFGIITIGIAALSMIARTNLKKLIAFSSVEGMGFITLGIGLGSTTALFWVLFFLGVHALVKALLFFSAGIIHRQYHSIKIGFIHNLFLLQPFSGTGLIIGTLALLGTPLLPLFAPKLFILSQVAALSLPLLFIILILLVIVAAAFILFLFKIIVTKESLLQRYNVPFSMKLPIIILLVLIFILGVFMPQQLQTAFQDILIQLHW